MKTVAQRPPKRLGQILKDAGLLDEGQLRQALASQRQRGGRLGRILVDMGFVEEATLMLALSRQLNLPPVDLDCTAITPEAVKTVHPEVAERYGIVPLSVNRRQRLLRVATSDPTNGDMLQALTVHTGMRVLFSVSAPASIDRAIKRHYHGENTTLAQLSAEIPAGVTQVNLAFQWPEGPSQDTERKVAAVDQRVAQLERLVAQQSFALRGMLEILDTRGVIRREEFLARMTETPSKPPPLPLHRTAKPGPRAPKPELLPELS